MNEHSQLAYETCVRTQEERISQQYSKRAVPEYLQDAILRIIQRETENARYRCDLRYPDIIAESEQVQPFLAQRPQGTYRFYVSTDGYILGTIIRSKVNELPGYIYILIDGGNVPNPYTRSLPTRTYEESYADYNLAIDAIVKIGKPRVMI